MQARIIVHTHDKSHLINPEDIVLLQGAGAYSEIFFRDRRSVRISKNLGYLMHRFPKSCDYLWRVHKSWIVNIDLIEYIESRESGFYLCMKGDFSVPVTPAMKSKLISMYMAQTPFTEEPYTLSNNP